MASQNELIIVGARSTTSKTLTAHHALIRSRSSRGSQVRENPRWTFDTIFAKGNGATLNRCRRMPACSSRSSIGRRSIGWRHPSGHRDRAENQVRNSRSTVGTDNRNCRSAAAAVRKNRPALFAPTAKRQAHAYHPGDIADALFSEYPDSRAIILFTLPVDSMATLQLRLQDLVRRGFGRLRLDDDMLDLTQYAVDEIASKLKDRPEVHVILDRVRIRADERSRLVEAVETAFREGHGCCLVDIPGVGLRRFTEHYGCQSVAACFETPKPSLFSFNHPLGASPCVRDSATRSVMTKRSHSTQEQEPRGRHIEPWTKPSAEWWQKEMLLALKRRGLDVTMPVRTSDLRGTTLLGKAHPRLKASMPFSNTWKASAQAAVRVMLSRYRSPFSCEACQGTRLRPQALAVRISNRSISDVSDMTITEAHEWLRP